MDQKLLKVIGKSEADSLIAPDKSKAQINDVILAEQKRFTGIDGSFNETCRLNEQGFMIKPEILNGFEIKQINSLRIFANSVKAWQLNLDQDEVWFVHPDDHLIVGLLDVRKISSTYKQVMRLSLGGGQAFLLYIPRGVAHGVSNPYFHDASITYFDNSWITDRDEYRLPYYYQVGRDFWELTKG
jgi:dTDP-4-dehydrorhamnose 3,5-epimerase-like enzyme